MAHHSTGIYAIYTSMLFLLSNITPEEIIDLSTYSIFIKLVYQNAMIYGIKSFCKVQIYPGYTIFVVWNF